MTRPLAIGGVKVMKGEWTVLSHVSPWMLQRCNGRDLDNLFFVCFVLDRQTVKTLLGGKRGQIYGEGN